MKKPAKKMTSGDKRAAKRQAATDTVAPAPKNDHNHAPAHRAQKHLIHTEAKRKNDVR